MGLQRSAFVIDENLEVSPGSAEFKAAADRRAVTSPSFPRVLGPYSHAVVAGGFVFVAGQAPINPSTQEFELGDIESETRLELTNMSAILEAAGSNLASVVKVSIHLSSLDDFDGMNRAYMEFSLTIPFAPRRRRSCAVEERSRSTVLHG
jgi:2-iminobutanoate/2-iminopropanoate deaminase